jgi:hypothetical protein
LSNRDIPGLRVGTVPLASKTPISAFHSTDGRSGSRE